MEISFYIFNGSTNLILRSESKYKLVSQDSRTSSRFLICKQRIKDNKKQKKRVSCTQKPNTFIGDFYKQNLCALYLSGLYLKVFFSSSEKW